MMIACCLEARCNAVGGIELECLPGNQSDDWLLCKWKDVSYLYAYSRSLHCLPASYAPMLTNRLACVQALSLDP